MTAMFRIEATGSGCSLQDLGRPGWRRFGVPRGGAMDRESARMANRLVGNSDEIPVLELAFTGARLTALTRGVCALTGADLACNQPQWRSFEVEADDEIVFGEIRKGVWTYLAVSGGFRCDRWFGSSSVLSRAGIGLAGTVGDILSMVPAPTDTAVAARYVVDADQADPVSFPVWPGPEWDDASEDDRARFLESEWGISPQSDRTGYRLQGPALALRMDGMLSSPLVEGTIQLPPMGQPIVLLRDGPTVGGYPRLAVLDPSVISRFTQRAPAEKVRFEMVQ